MKIKIFTLSLFVIIFLTDAMKVTDEDSDSPLITYLLAKVQQLEIKMMARSNIRNTRETTDKPTTKPPVVAADNKQCNCPPSTVTYIIPLVPMEQIRSYSTHDGAAVDPLCLPPSPQYLKYQNGYQGYVRLHGAEYKIDNGSLINHAHDRNVPCALCQVYDRTNKIMIPSHYECPLGWRRGYYGYLMAGYHGHKAATQYTCVDKSLEMIPGSGATTGGYFFYTVEAYCNHFIPCSDKELTCVVCTKSHLVLLF